MDDTQLRKRLIRLAYVKPALRAALVPLLRQAKVLKEIPSDALQVEVWPAGSGKVRVSPRSGRHWEVKLPERGIEKHLKNLGFKWDTWVEAWQRKPGASHPSTYNWGGHLYASTRTLEADTSLTGKTMENDSLRFHVYRGSVRVWDLTNAGKRGKKVEGFVLYDFDYGMSPEAEKAVEQWTFRLKRLDYRKAKSEAEKLLKEFGSETPMKMHGQEKKGVHVAPAGFGPFKKATPEFDIEATWTEYSVRDRADKYNEPACYNTGKRDVKRFYRWVTDNWNRLKNLTYNELTSRMSKEGFKFRSFCRMD